MYNLQRIVSVPLLFFLFFPECLKAQFPLVPDRIAGAGSTLFQQNLSSAAFGNPALPDSVTGPRAYIYSTQSFLSPELTETGVAVSIRLPGSSQLAAGFAHRGFDLYSKQLATFSISRHFSGFSAGFRAEYNSTRFAEGYPGDHHWTVVPGTRIRFGRQVEVVALMQIPVRREDGKSGEETRLGCIHHFSSRFSAGAEAVQNERGVRLSAAMRYRPGNRIDLHVGLSGAEPVWSFGCSMVVKGVRILLAASHRAWLGFSPGLSVESPLVRP